MVASITTLAQVGSATQQLSVKKSKLFQALTGKFALDVQTGLTKIGLDDANGLLRLTSCVSLLMRLALCDEGLLVAFVARTRAESVVKKLADSNLLIVWEDEQGAIHRWGLRQRILIEGRFKRGDLNSIAMPVLVRTRGRNAGWSMEVVQQYSFFEHIVGTPIGKETACHVRTVSFFPAGTSWNSMVESAQHRVGATISTSFGQLQCRESKRYERLGLLHREISVDAAAAVLGIDTD